MTAVAFGHSKTPGPTHAAFGGQNACNDPIRLPWSIMPLVRCWRTPSRSRTGGRTVTDPYTHSEHRSADTPLCSGSAVARSHINLRTARWRRASLFPSIAQVSSLCNGRVLSADGSRVHRAAFPYSDFSHTRPPCPLIYIVYVIFLYFILYLCASSVFVLYHFACPVTL